ncbi:MAG TPA: tetratricopeptide repeat protein [Herpetosiphonaceae bacterium]
MTESAEDIFSFGTWVRRRRKALDLTQVALAHRVGCAEVSIRKWEADALRPSLEVAQRLADCLDIPAELHEKFVQAARAECCVDRLPKPAVAIELDRAAAPEPPSRPPMPRSLPAQTTPLIGREDEITRVCSLLRESHVRLLTLTGPGGIGKTRLSLAVGAEVMPRSLAVDPEVEPLFPDGVFFVPLATLSDPNLVVVAIAQALAVQETNRQPLIESLKSFLHSRKLLLILDNFEHLLSAAGVVAGLLRAAPELKVLVTSRALLHVYGERSFSVPSLAYPDPAVLFSPELLLQCGAIQLFMDRVRAVDLSYPFDDAAISTVAQICRRLEGLPLAIELAAARISLYSPTDMLACLEQALPFLKGGAVDQDDRHQTLSHTIAWSYNLLKPSERTLFRRLAVFVGGFTLGAAISVCDLDNTPDLLDEVQALLDQSLLKKATSAGGEPRFCMLAMIREFALIQLTLSGELEIVALRHAHHYRRLAEAAEPKLVRQESIAWLDRLDVEYSNLRAALGWLSERQEQAELGLGLAGALWQFWDLRGQFAEGRQWLDTLLASSEDLPAAARVKALDGAGVLAKNQGDYARATSLHEQSLAFWTAQADQLGIARSRLYLGVVACSTGNLSKAKDDLDSALTMLLALAAKTASPAPEVGQRLTQVQNALGLVACGYSDYDQACRYFERALALSREQGNPGDEAHILSHLGGLKNRLRQYREAQEYLEQSLTIRRALRSQPGEAITLYNLAVAEQETFQYGEAQKHFLAALKIHQTTGDRREQINVQLCLGILYQQIGDLTEACSWLQRALSLCHSLEYETGQAFVLVNLGPVLRDMGDLMQAEQVLHQARALAEKQQDKGMLSYCLSWLGIVYLDRDRAEQAVEVACQALVLRREIGMLTWAIADVATLAAAYLALDQRSLACTYANQTMLLLTRGDLGEPESPQRDYFRCYQVYAALGHRDLARRALKSAYSIVQDRAAQLSDTTLRQSFLTRVRINHAIVQEAERVLPAPGTPKQHAVPGCCETVSDGESLSAVMLSHGAAANIERERSI